MRKNKCNYSLMQVIMMINSRNTLIILTSFLLSPYLTVQAQHIKVQSHLKKYYDQFNVEGTFVLYDQEADKYLVYNPALSDQAVTPASTDRKSTRLNSSHVKISYAV